MPTPATTPSEPFHDGLDILRNWLDEVTTDKAVSLLVTAIQERQTHDSYTAEVMRQVFSRDNLTAVHAKQLAETYLEFGSTPELRQQATALLDMDIHLLSLTLKVEDCDTSLLGSLCRLIDQHSSKVPAQMMKTACGQLMNAKNCPVEVVARILTLPGKDQLPASKIQTSFWGESFLPEASIVYPDLADLPDKLLAEIVASQPIPDAWFVNIWDSDRLRPAGSAQPNQWETSWGEVVAERQ